MGKLKKEKTKDGILHRIKSGEYGQFERLPSERVLANLLGVSRVTIRGALLELVDERILKRHDGNRLVVNRIPSSSVRPGKVNARRTICYVYYASYKFNWFTSRTSNPYLLYSGVEKFIKDHDDILMMQSGDNFEKLLVEDNFRPDGILLMGTGLREKIPMLLQRGIPLVVVDCLPAGLAVDAVCCDNYDAGQMCAREMINCSRKNILYLGIQFEGENFIQPNFEIRLDGLKRGLGSQGRVFEDYLPWRASCSEGIFAEYGNRLAEKILENRIDAIVLGTGLLDQFLGWFLRHHASVAGKLEIAAIDESGMAGSGRKITRVCLDMEKLGYLGCRRLYEKLDNPSLDCVKYLVSATVMKK